ncbi:MAG TPA: tetratricopeptide repeat protein, partial [Candidatus Limnocylindria bacterium]|nr:tetratricopeptide repeat protein [Candidatus Limnocylindria bacterium]
LPVEAGRVDVRRLLPGTVPGQPGVLPRPEERAETLCLHFLRAERYLEAWKYARLAGDRAREKAANVDAAGFYRQALDAAQLSGQARPDEVAALAEKLGDVCEIAGLYQDGLRAYRTARRVRAGMGTVPPDLFRKEGLVQERLGRYPKAEALYRQGLRVAASMTDEEEAARSRARVQVAMAGALQYEGRLRAGLWWARKGARLAAEHDVMDVLAHAYYLIDNAYTDLGDQAAAKEYRGLALPIYQQLGDLIGQVKVLNNLGANAYLEGQWNEAIAFYERGLDAAERAGDTVHVAMLSTNIAEVLLQQGHHEEAERLLKEALQTQRGTGHRIGEAWSQFNLGVSAARAGRTEEAYNLLTQAREKFSEMGAESYVLEVSARLAEVHLVAGDHRSARATLSRAMRDVEARGGLVLEALMRRLQAYALLQAGDPDQALAVLERSCYVAEMANATYELALTLDAMWRFGEVLGRPRPEERRRASSLLEDLGVVRTPVIPLPSDVEPAASGSHGLRN